MNIYRVDLSSPTRLQFSKSTTERYRKAQDPLTAHLQNGFTFLSQDPLRKNIQEMVSKKLQKELKVSAQKITAECQKSGYLDKQGQNFKNWKTRYFVLTGQKVNDLIYLGYC